MMIGDQSARGRGVGGQAFRAVVSWLGVERDEPVIYTRHLDDNISSAKLAERAGFEYYGDQYRDNDGLMWQNEIYQVAGNGREAL
ncbi:MAG: GNAT family N-acetyltransferase [Candidatus Saccharimonadales bacterium]